MNTRKSERQQERTITALLSTNSLQSAAKKAGISKRTIIRWLDKPEFRDAYAKAKRHTLRTASAILMRESAKAALALVQIFEGKPAENQSSRVSAAKGVLRLALDSFVTEDLEERLRKLESQNDHDHD